MGIDFWRSSGCRRRQEDSVTVWTEGTVPGEITAVCATRTSRRSKACLHSQVMAVVRWCRHRRDEYSLVGCGVTTVLTVFLRNRFTLDRNRCTAVGTYRRERLRCLGHRPAQPDLESSIKRWTRSNWPQGRRVSKLPICPLQS